MSSGYGGVTQAKRSPKKAESFWLQIRISDRLVFRSTHSYRFVQFIVRKFMVSAGLRSLCRTISLCS